MAFPTLFQFILSSGKELCMYGYKKLKVLRPMPLLRGNLTSLYFNPTYLLQITVINAVKLIPVIKYFTGLKYYLHLSSSKSLFYYFLFL